MAYIPHTSDEREGMLQKVGVRSLEELFQSVPARVRFPELDLSSGISELELERELLSLAQCNQSLQSQPSFLGAGCYRHFVPATVDYVLQRGEFYTSYTPYQPEISQGVLQAIYEYQTMICRLTGMEVSNASHYDGATSLAEAVLLSLDVANGRRPKVVMSPYVHPHYRAVTGTYLQGTDANLEIAESPHCSAIDLIEHVDTDTAALVIQTPNFFGGIEDLTGVADKVHAKGALLVVVVDPISLGLFLPPGHFGADVVVADGQPLGIAPSFGGPSLGIFATRREHIRRLVGRLVGRTEDRQGRQGFVLTLATREQHIRRAKATSNICTNSALGALAAAVFLATVGEQGLRRMAELCFHKAHYAAAKIGEIPGCVINSHAPNSIFFKEFVVSLPLSAANVLSRLHDEHGLTGGYDLGKSFEGERNKMIVSVTEMNTRDEIDRLTAALRDVLH